jgi:uncharacterized protein (TIGR03083 family)
VKIRPRYGPDPLITYEGDPAAVATPAVRQRLRLAQTLAAFGPAQWDAPSRCAGWTNRDVVVHLVSANRWWVRSISEARRGRPTEMLADFDPVATPAALVAAAGNLPAAEALDAYVRSTHALAELLGSLTGGEWTMPGENPLGHLSISANVRHALWDGWVHERDITLGLGLAPAVEPDEVDAALRCAAALGPAFGLLLGDLDEPGLTATVTAQDPAVGFTIEVGQAVRVTAGPRPAAPVAVHGPAVDLLEGLSLRTSLELEPQWRWLTAGLERSFEVAPHTARVQRSRLSAGLTRMRAGGSRQRSLPRARHPLCVAQLHRSLAGRRCPQSRPGSPSPYSGAGAGSGLDDRAGLPGSRFPRPSSAGGRQRPGRKTSGLTDRHGASRSMFCGLR